MSGELSGSPPPTTTTLLDCDPLTHVTQVCDQVFDLLGLMEFGFKCAHNCVTDTPRMVIGWRGGRKPCKDYTSDHTNSWRGLKLHAALQWMKYQNLTRRGATRDGGRAGRAHARGSAVVTGVGTRHVTGKTRGACRDWHR